MSLDMKTSLLLFAGRNKQQRDARPENNNIPPDRPTAAVISQVSRLSPVPKGKVSPQPNKRPNRLPEDVLEGDLGSPHQLPKHPIRKSLRKTLPDILNDPIALHQFTQYMQSKDAGGYIKFLVDADRFSSLSSLCLDMVTGRRAPFENGNHEERKKLNLRFSIENQQNVMSPGSESSGFFDETPTDHRDDRVFSNQRSEAVSIYNKYIAKDATDPIGASTDARNNLIKKIFDQSMELSETSFAEVEDMVISILESEYLPDFFLSKHSQKHLLDLLTSDQAQVCDILNNEAAFAYFSEFMEKSGQKNLLDFWLSADGFKAQAECSEGSWYQVKDDAMVLYNRYFSLQATTPLTIAEGFRNDLELNICRDGGPSLDCFEAPLTESLNILEREFFPLFLRSEEYSTFLTELMKSCAGMESRHRRQGSDSTISSDYSQTTSSVFSYPITPKPVRTNAGAKSFDFSIDIRELHDPDSLWKRNHTRTLSIGSVTELGRFIPELDPQPDIKTKSSLSKAIRRLMTNEDEAQLEESAWRQAESIIKSITDITIENLKNPGDIGIL